MQGPGWRQKPGFACEECRRRKARCDRQQPQCGSCAESGVKCITVSQRPQRGPKKGQLEMMRTRIAMLERELKQSDSQIKSPTLIDVPMPTVTMPGTSITGLENSSFTDINDIPTDSMSHMSLTHPYLAWPSLETPSSNNLPELDIIVEEHLNLGNVSPIKSTGDPEISNLMLADLDDIYFDRAHNICPMVHQQRYFTMAGQANCTLAQECLTSAMRTLAAAMSAPYRGLVNMLYTKTCRLLEEFRQASRMEASWSTLQDNVPIEYIQSWLLLAHYESLQMNEWQALLTAGRAFRLVQMARLHDIDALDKTTAIGTPGSEADDRFALLEERRRTFWVAYNLDCFLSWRNEWPLTLYEDMVATRLPAPEANFQNSHPVNTDSLSEALTKDGSTTHSPFAECGVLVTLHSRCMAHRRASSRESGKDPGGFWDRHSLLAEAVERRIELLAQTPMTPTIERDSMVFFTHMLAHSAVICLGITVQRMAWQATEHQRMATAYEQRASRAASEMVRLVKGQPSLSCFKAHPFLPNLLASAITFLNTQDSADDQADAQLLLRLLRDLRDVNSLAYDTCLTYDKPRLSSL
ncbi:hypothetical protein F5B19DRAFT_486976 [Rostrohypoxylon terebratum]|nr:hypothetical protein F5B19DRAFT_486976 [Rostrohypoxylon terebratum]